MPSPSVGLRSLYQPGLDTRLEGSGGFAIGRCGDVVWLRPATLLPGSLFWLLLLGSWQLLASPGSKNGIVGAIGAAAFLVFAGTTSTG